MLGIAPGPVVYVEEFYGEDGWLAQRALRLDGAVLAEMDEAHGARAGAPPLELPADLITPVGVNHTQSLNFSGPRRRGMRAEERIDDMVFPLPVAAKMALAQRMQLDLPLLLGIVESRVLAETPLAPDCWLVCRRLRLAYALPQPRRADDGALYDYDSSALHLAHCWTPDDDGELLTEAALAGLPGAHLRRPLDCLAAHGYLFVAEGGAPDQRAALHVWRLLPPN
ncbi:MAG: hypothetical protein ACUVSX_09610 [Aggregatilineales bacterium]